MALGPMQILELKPILQPHQHIFASQKDLINKFLQAVSFRKFVQRVNPQSGPLSLHIKVCFQDVVTRYGQGAL